MCADVTPRARHASPRGDQDPSDVFIEWTVQVVASFLRRNAMAADDLPALIAATHAALTNLHTAARADPAVAVSDSVQDDYLVCLEDGKKLKTLRRHLRQAFRLSPDEYRKKWGLPDDYPMIAPAYRRTRSRIGRAATYGSSNTKG